MRAQGPEVPEALDGTRGGRRSLVLAVHDELVQRGTPQPPETIAMEGARLRVSYVGEGATDPSHLDGWICPPRPTKAGRIPFALTLACELLEQDPDGALVRDGWPSGSRILGFGVVATKRGGELQVGRRAALLVGSLRGGVWSARIGITAALVWVFAYPVPEVDAPMPRDWLTTAYGLAYQVRAGD